MSKRFSNILVMWGAIQLLWMLLLRLWSGLWDAKLLWCSLSASLWLSTVSESIVFDLLWGSCNLYGISWTIWFLDCDQPCFHLLHNKFFGYLCNIIAQSKRIKCKVPRLEYIVFSSVQLSNHTQRKLMHQLPWYYQPQQEPFSAWTALVMWYTCHDIHTHTKIL